MLLSCKSSYLYSRHKPHINAWFEQFLPFYKFLVSIIWMKKFKVGSRLFGWLVFGLFFSFLRQGLLQLRLAPNSIYSQSWLQTLIHLPSSSRLRDQGRATTPRKVLNLMMSTLCCLCFPCFGVLRDHVNQDGGILSQALIIWGSAWPLIHSVLLFMFAVE